MNLTPLQWIGISIAIAGALSTGTVQLTDIFGGHIAKIIASAASLTSGVLGGVVTSLAGQSSIVRQVQAMPGVEKIVVGAQSNQTLASLAIDQDQPKIEPAPGATQAVAQIAKGN